MILLGGTGHRRRRQRLAALIAIVIAGLVAAALIRRTETPTTPLAPAGTGAPPSQPVMVAAAGDIACDPASPRFQQGQAAGRACAMEATSGVLADGRHTVVLALGDVQYGARGLADFRSSYGPTWGRLKAVTRPVPGDSDYDNKRAAPYFAYFGAAAGKPGQGWYSFDVGGWHLIALNSNCRHVGGCHKGSPQERWLQADLAAHRTRCTLAYWHHPLFGSNVIRVNRSVQAFWRNLYDAGAELVLNGHNHFYERLTPQDPAGRPNPARGIRQFIVGTGGDTHQRLSRPVANSQVRDDTTFGVLRLTLRPDGYSWEFVPATADGFSDSGSGRCH